VTADHQLAWHAAVMKGVSTKTWVLLFSIAGQSGLTLLNAGIAASPELFLAALALVMMPENIGVSNK
jgi:hypothetical protein